MSSQDSIVETILQSQKQKEEPQNAPKPSGLMKAFLIKKGEYTLSNSFVLPSLDLCLLGEQDTILIPQQNVLTILGVGNKDIKCHKCGYVLAMKIKREQIQGIAIKCPSCGIVNRL